MYAFILVESEMHKHTIELKYESFINNSVSKLNI